MNNNLKIVITATFSSILLLASLLISSGVSAADFFTIGSKKFNDHTYVGPFNISNTKSKNAKSKLASDFTELQSNIEVNYHYQDHHFEVPTEVFSFDIDATIASAQSGEDNPIIVHVSREGLTTVLRQELPFLTLSDESIDAIAAGTEEELETGIMPRNIHVTDYLNSNAIPVEKIASSIYSMDGISTAFLNGLKALDGKSVGAFESVSLAELLNSTEIGVLSDEESTILASLVYSAILQTNFTIDERNISAVLSSTIQPGFEATLDIPANLDFRFTNPNKSSFTLRTDSSGGEIQFWIEGIPLYYEYEPDINEVETFQPRTVVQYSAFVSKGQVTVKKEGKEGISAVVNRTIKHDGQLIDSIRIAKDFYAPLSKVELHPLEKEEKSGSADNSSETNSSEQTNDNQNTGTLTDHNNQDQTTGENQNNSENQGNTDTDNNTGSGNNNGPSSSTNNSADKSGKLEYDKSGLPITGK
ncbi:VanW family protein [Sporosarcina sp. Sa2YVA2]|uniref:VanW family protein n=1 Tax=Sporosarcina quadrami TaxID=2762234 RepID=A0ABR8U5Q0_9BACL|nr:VanW family protein [Sporosarcina quadrami]MBD7983023.1 VanW family protein [Sporosarcina quadrami]